MKLIAVLVPALLALGNGSAAAREARDPGQVTEREKAKGEQIECRSNLATGSRLRTNKTCMIKREWKEQDTAMRRDMQDASDSPNHKGV